MTRTTIPVFKPLLGVREQAAARDALELGWLGMGEYVGRFEAELAARIGAPDRHVVATSTGHAALHLALMLAGIGPGDEVVTPSFNNVADFQAIRAVGAEPAFCDVLEDTLCLDPASVETVVGPRTRAIVATDYACHHAQHGRIRAIAERHELRVIHDASHSFGWQGEGGRTGADSDIATFSFDPVKTFTAIDGGAIVVRSEADREFLRRARLIGMGQSAERMYGNQRAWTYDVEGLGFRYHLANLHAAIGLAQLSQFDEIARSRRATCAYYGERLAGLDGLTIPRIDLESVVPFIYYLRVHGGKRESFRAFLRDRGIDTGIHWQPGHHFSYFRDAPAARLAVTERIAGEIVTIPLHSNMDAADADRVVDAVRSFFASA